MPNDSSTGGYLSPASSRPVEDDAFEDFIGNVVAGITGLARAMVRPRWQPKPPPHPPITTNWCAIGITTIVSDYGTVSLHNPAGQGADQQQRHDTVDLLASFYGPGAYSLASRLRDGLMVSQNRRAMREAGINLLESTRMRTASDLLNERFIRRVDLEVRLRRAFVRTYPILNVLSVSGVIQAQDGEPQPFTVEN
jgi:hypothetical protein